MGAIRRHGPELDEVILDAAWQELADHGYHAMTMSAVAARAQTAKTVIYRRWPDKASLITAAVQRRIPNLTAPPTSGTLRGNLINLIQQLVDSLDGLHRSVGLNNDLVGHLRLHRIQETNARIAAVLADHGVDYGRLNPIVLQAPVHLVVGRLLAGLPAEPDAIVDQVMVPLLLTQPARLPNPLREPA